MSRLICLLTLVVGVSTLSGCGQQNSGIAPELLAKHRASLTLAEEPDGALVVPEVRDLLLGVSDEPHDHDHDHGDHSEHEAEHADEDGHDPAEHAEHEDEDGVEDEDEDDEEDEDEELADEDDEEDEDDEDEEEEHEEHAEHEDEDHGDDDHADHEHEEDGHEEHADHEGHDQEKVAVIHATEPMKVVLVGQIGGLTNPWKESLPDYPFARGEAAFALADPMSVVENEEDGHNHAPGEECAFCEAHATDLSSMLAMVRFLDRDGKVLQVDVRQLFDLKVGDTVVIEGVARVIEGGMMIVDATGLYLRE